MTIKDIARKTGVSPSAVSLVLNGKASGRVSAAKQEAILRVAAASGFQLNLSARRLRGKSLRLVGVAMPSPIVTCYGMMADRLHSHCTERGYSVIFAFWDSYASTSAAYAALQRQDVDGLIAWENRHPEAARSTPTVMFGCRLDDFDCIQYDFESIVPTAYDHLRQLATATSASMPPQTTRAEKSSKICFAKRLDYRASGMVLEQLWQHQPPRGRLRALLHGALASDLRLLPQRFPRPPPFQLGPGSRPENTKRPVHHRL